MGSPARIRLALNGPDYSGIKSVIQGRFLRPYPQIVKAQKDWAKQTGIDYFTEILLKLILARDPEPVAPKDLWPVTPHTHPDVPAGLIAAAEESGFLEIAEPGTFRISTKGREALGRLQEDLAEASLKYNPLNEAEAGRLANLMDRWVLACLDRPHPPEPWHLGHILKLSPPKVPALAFILNRLSCMVAYRADCHAAAWRAAGIDGVAIDALTMLWNGDAGSVAQVARLQKHRGQGVARYSQAFAWLREQGFLRGTDGRASITAKGKKFREEIERKTDAWQFAPLAELAWPERAELSTLLAKLPAPNESK